MNRRIKFIHILTICVIMAFVLSQAYWLLNRYRLALQERENDLFTAIISAVEKDVQLRTRPLVNPVEAVRQEFYTRKVMKTMPDSTIMMNLTVVFGEPSYNIFMDSTDNFNLDSTQMFNFDLKMDAPVSSELIDRAVELFRINHNHPFAVEDLDSLLHQQGIAAIRTEVDSICDSLLWGPVLQRHSSLLRPRIVVTYPFDILQNRVVKVEADIVLSPIFKDMAFTLAVSVLLSVFLIFCLVYQILTIRKQRHIEAIRQEFLHTMIHELKRPIATLKMCVSFMGNDRMMEDEESKKRILASSHHELDNLTSYFSKLRDITLSDATEIPLVKSDFSLRELIEECIGKQNIPTGKEVKMDIVAEGDVEAWADRMHIGNIVCNLLENAIKYSRETVTIRIDYRMREDGMVQTSIADNGIGIAKADQRYVFDKFYRSETAKDKSIPGIGLGLSYVKLLVEAHDGTITFESTEGEGTTFIILIPQTDGKDKDIARG